MQVGVFDSGKGGGFVAEGLAPLLPSCSFTVIDDTKNVPYGSRRSKEVVALTEAAITPLTKTCPIIVIACNTATMAGIEQYRRNHPGTKIVGIEPMIKPAGEISKTRHITVLATPRTLSSARYRRLIARFGGDLTIDQPNTSHWARTIENGEAATIDYSELADSIASGSDTVVLACTHYIVLKQAIEQLFPDATVLEPTAAIARQIDRLMSERAG